MADAELSVRITGDTSDLEGAINRVEQQLNNLSNAGGSGTQSGVRNIENEYTRAGKKIKETGEAIDAATKPLQKASVALAAGGVASAKFAIDFENSFADVTKTVDGTDAQLNKIKQDIIDMSTKGINGHSAIPQTTTELNELAAAGGQLGIQTENISKFTETMAMIGSATNLSGEAGAKTLARFMNVTGTSQDQVQNLGSAVVDLGNNFATTEAEIMDMAMNMGATGSAVNISAQDILAYSTVLSSLGAEAASGGSAISRIWMDIQSAVSEGGSELSTFAQMSGKSAEQFSSDWKSNASGAFKDLIQGLSESQDIVGDLQKMGFNNIRDIQALQKLAGPQGMQLLNEALERSNTAWSENTALVNEFENKAGTTASQLAITKNNVIEAGRSIGEMLLPSINNGAVGVKNFAQGIANMSDGQKQAIVTTGKWVIGLGATAKATAGTMKGAGNLAETFGKLASTGSKGSGLFAALSKGAAAVGTAAPYAAAGIVAVTGAVKIGKAAYDSWYKSQYKWTEGLSESDEKLQSSLNSYKKLSQAQRELKEARALVANPDSSQEEVDAAKKKIEEIAAKLEEEYNLKINADNPDLDNTIEKVKKLSGNELKQAIADEQMQLAGLADKYKESLTKLPELQANYDQAQERLTYLKLLQSEYAALETTTSDGVPTQEQMDTALNNVAKAMGITADEAKALYDGTTPIETALKGAQNEVDNLKPKIDDLTATQKEYQAVATSFSNKLSEYFSEQLVSGDLEGASQTLTRLGKAAADAGLDLKGYGEVLTNIARVSGMINENQTINISATGDVSILEEVEGKVKEVQTLDGTTISVTAEGDVSILDEAGNEVQYLAGIGAVSLSVNANGNIDVLDQAGEKIAEIPQNVDTNTTVTITKDSSEVDNYQPEDKEGKANYQPNTGAVDAWQPPQKEGTVVYHAVVEGAPTPNAKGTQNFKGGLAMINDQRGVTDPRELVEVNGKGYIFEGRDVVLPLPKHSKVYTATQTKRIMAANNIPHYARGKDNEEWENAKNDWSHYTKVNEVTAYEALEHWDEMLAKFKGDAEVIKEIQEEIVSSTKDMWNEDIDTMQFFLDMGVDSEEHYYKWLETYRDEHFEGNTEQWRKATLEIHKYQQEQAQAIADMLNKESEEYIKLHTIAGDWTDIGDSAIAAFGRVKDRAELDIAAGLKSKEEADEYLKELGADIYQSYADDADNWISHERNYNAMSTDDYIASLNRKRAKTKEFFDNQLIDYETYISEVQKSDEQLLDAYATKVNDWRDNADWYQQQAEVYGWGFNGTGHESAESFWKTRLDIELVNANDENLSENERQNALRYADKARMEVYKARQDALDEELEAFRQSIEDTREALDDEVQELQDSWTKADRKNDIADIEAQMQIYKNAQTKEGIDKYESLQDELKQLRREEKLEKLQEKNARILENLEEEYADMEEDQLSELAGLKDELLSYGGVAKMMNDSKAIAESANQSVGIAIEKITGISDTLSTFSEKVLKALGDIQASTVTNNYEVSQYNTNNIRDGVSATAAFLGSVGSLSMMLFGRRG